jgi:hypothetical protein
VTSYVTDAMKWLRSNANSAFELPETMKIVAAFFAANRTKQISLTESLGGHYDVMNLQAESTNFLVNMPKNSSLWSLLKRLSDWFVPEPFKATVSDWIENMRWIGFNGLYEKLKHLAEVPIIWLTQKFSGLILQLFPQLNPLASVILEEAIKTLPFGGLIISTAEIVKYWSQDTIWTKLFRFLAHASFDIFTTPVKLITLPFRIFVHYKWNEMQNKIRRKWLRQKPEFEIADDSDNHEDNAGPFKVVDHASGYKRFVRPEKEIYKSGIIEKRPDLQKLEQDDYSHSSSPVYVTISPKLGGVSGAKTMANMYGALVKRNLQDQPLKKIKYNIKSTFRGVAEILRHKLIQEPISTQEWIDLPNHAPKRKLYQKAFEKFKDDGNVEYVAKINLKLDELNFAKKMRTTCAFDNSYVVNVAPSIHSYSKALKTACNGYNNFSDDPRYTLHLFYVSGYTATDICKVIQDNQAIGTAEKPHYLLMVLGDDTALINKNNVLATDFSRYDSTQNKFFHSLFRAIMMTDWNMEAIRHMEIAEEAPVSFFHFNTAEKFSVHPQGLKTGCPETSVSNSTVTMTAYAAAIVSAYELLGQAFENRDFRVLGNYIEEYLTIHCGFLPKAVYQDLRTGAEFLKTIFVIQDDQVVAAPLLSSVAKIGKFMKPPVAIVPLAKIKSIPQISIDATYMQLKGKGAMSDLPGFSIWYNALTKLSWTMSVYQDSRAPRIEKGITTETMAMVYEHRYKLTWDEIERFFKSLAELGFEDYPLRYTSEVLARSVECDYGVSLLGS